MTTIKTEALPVLEKLGARREIPSTALPELRKIFAGNQPIKEWRIVGPFPGNERPPVPTNKKVDTSLTVKGPGGVDLKWATVNTKSPVGEINLGDLYSGQPLDKKAAFAYAEIDSPEARPARVAIGSDDSIQLWVNGKMVHRHNEDRGFTAEQDMVDINVVKGANRFFVKSGNSSGGWQFSVGFSSQGDYAFLKGPAPGAFDPEAFRSFAAGNKGKADRGKTLFNDPKGIGCIKCHAVAGLGGTVGPDLTGIATRYPREELVHSVLYPSAKIFSGYEPTVVATTDGKVITGIVKSDNAEGLVIEDIDAKKHTIKKDQIEERRISDVSLMPNGLAEGLSREDFADLIGYLETLKDAPAKPNGGR